MFLDSHLAPSPFTYLGVPLFIGKPRKTHLRPIVDNIIVKPSSSKGKLLLYMGRVEHVKSTALSMLTHSFMIYNWPTSLIKTLDFALQNFIWTGDTLKCKIATVPWSQICMPIAGGGLGLRSIKRINCTALLKLGWKFEEDKGL